MSVFSRHSRFHLFFGSLIIAMMITLPWMYQRANFSKAGAGDTFRVNEYYLSDGSFSGTSFNLFLNQDLVSNYFVIVRGSDGDQTTNNDRGPDENYAALTADPFGTGDLASSGVSNVITLTRSNAVNSWVGVVTVVECTADCANSGFQLLDTQLVSHPGSDTSGTDTSGSSWSDINQVMLMGGYNGSGCTTAQASTTNTKVCHARLFPSAINTINWSRSATDATLSAATSTVMVLEWGSQWTVQRVNVTGNSGGNGAAAVNQYDTAAITPVTRDNTWVWGTGHTNDQGIGDASEGSLITLGNGVNQFATETTVAVGQEYADTRSFDVYALTHDELAVDYRFKPDGDQNELTVDVPVDLNSDSTARMALMTNGQNGTGNAYPRPIFSARYTTNTTIRLERRRFGQTFPAWVQGVDFSSIQPGVDLSSSSKDDDDVDNSVLPGQTVNYSITLSNTGTIGATGVDLDDTISGNLENLSIQSITNCGGSLSDSSTTTTLNIDDLDIAVGLNCVIVYSTQVKAGLVQGTLIANSVQVSASDQGSLPFVLNSPDLTVGANTDISVSVSVDNPITVKGVPLVLSILATNTSGTAASQVQVSSVIPGGFSFNSATPSQGSYDDSTGIWNIGTLAPAGNATLDINTDISTTIGAEVTHWASLMLSNPIDVVVANNVGSSGVTISDGGVGGGGGGGRRITVLQNFCGDDVLYTEECDDGNTNSGDGCSSECRVESPLLAPVEEHASAASRETDSAKNPVQEAEQVSATDCQYIEHPLICAHMKQLFGDDFGNVRQAPQVVLKGSAEAACLNLDVNRSLVFEDLDADEFESQFITLLKNTQIAETGDYVFSGQGNHSSGNEPGRYAEGAWLFGPDDVLSRAAALKTILIANCIPIEKSIPIPADGFEFRDIPLDFNTRDSEQYYLARIFYTAYEAGLIKGYADETARPHQHITGAEVLALLLRSSRIVGADDENEDWESLYMRFARQNGLLNQLRVGAQSKVLRKTFAVLLLRAMSYNPDGSVHGYVERIDLNEQRYREDLPSHRPEPFSSRRP